MILEKDEQTDFLKLFNKRLKKVKEKTERVFKFKDIDFPPFLVNSAFYHLFGLDEKDIPGGYYSDPEIMTGFQEVCFYEQIKNIEDYFVPYLVPWFGTVVLSSALGAQIELRDKEDPAVNPRCYAIRDEQDINKLDIPDPERAGLMPKVLAFLTYMKQNSFLPVGITDCQGPLATASQLLGYDKLFLLMYDKPNLAHELMEKICESLIVWIKKQKEVIGERLGECFGGQQVYVGRHAGVWMSDDDAVLISPHLYAEFVVPYNSKIFQTFCGGILHYCGNANHQIDNFLNTKGLVGVNNYLLHDIKGIAELKKKIGDRIVLFACDFTPIEYQYYYRELLQQVSPKGLIVDSQFSPVVALTRDGKYAPLYRLKKTERKDVFDCISQLQSNPRQ